MKFKISKQDVDEGVRVSSTDCVVAKCMNRKLPEGYRCLVRPVNKALYGKLGDYSNPDSTVVHVVGRIGTRRGYIASFVVDTMIAFDFDRYKNVVGREFDIPDWEKYEFYVYDPSGDVDELIEEVNREDVVATVEG